MKKKVLHASHSKFFLAIRAYSFTYKRAASAHRSGRSGRSGFIKG